MITGEQIDNAAHEFTDPAQTVAVHNDSHPEADEVDEQTFEQHLNECEGCAVAEAVNDSWHAEAFTRFLVWQLATEGLCLAAVIGNALSFGVRIGLRLSRQPDEQPLETPREVMQ